jgi:hypothetical protein
MTPAGNIDETLLHTTLRLTPDQRFDQFDGWYAFAREISPVWRPWPVFDPRTMLVSLVRAEVEFVVTGGIAAVAHGSAELTQELEIALAPRDEKRERLATPGRLVVVSVSDFAALRERADVVEIVGVEVRIASIEDLIAMKKAAGRPKDLIAVEELEAIKRLR